VTAPRCCEASLEAGELLSATAAFAESWLLVEVRGGWPRDVSEGGTLPEPARSALRAWAERVPRSRILFVRRPGRVAERSLAFLVRAREEEGEVRRFELDGLEAFGDVDLDGGGERVPGSLVLVCGHGSRDRCCAERGTAAYRALEGGLREEQLWVSSHHGGHRFAPNVLVLPAGLHFGRVPPAEAPSLVARALSGTIELRRYRGRTCYEPPVQAAEHAVRAATGLNGVGDLALVGVEGGVVRFRGRDGGVHEAVVEEARGPAVPPSCGTQPEPQRLFTAGLPA